MLQILDTMAEEATATPINSTKSGMNGAMVENVIWGGGALAKPAEFSNRKIRLQYIAQAPLARQGMPHNLAAMFGCKNGTCGARRKMGVTTQNILKEPAAVDPGKVAAEFHLSNGENLMAASDKRMLALVFLRHFGCTFTRQILRGLEDLQLTAKAQGAELVLVHMLKDGSELRYLGGHDEVARIADPRCDLYRAFGLGRGGFMELFGPRVWWLGAISIFKGCGVGHLAGDGLQMPGAFLFQYGKIIASQRAKSAADMPDLPQLFAEMAPEAS